MMCPLSQASFNLLPTPSHPNPLCCPPTSPWSLSLWTSFPISLPDAASRPFQILLSADKSCTDVGRAGTGNSQQHGHPVPAGRGSFLLGTRGRGGVGEKKREKKDWRQKKREDKVSHWNQKGNAWVRFLSGNTVGGRGGGRWENKNKRAKCARWLKTKTPQKSLGGYNEGGGSGQKYGWKELKSRNRWGVGALRWNPSRPPLSTQSLWYS